MNRDIKPKLASRYDKWTMPSSKYSYFSYDEAVSVIIPCLNEQDTVGSVVSACKRNPLVSQVIVVDDGSTDASAQRAVAAGATIVPHKKNMGKAHAIKTGAAKASNDILVFIDADLRMPIVDIIDRLALPILEQRAEISKARFARSQGRVTELTAKPLLNLLYPEIKLDQPLSGQFAIRKSLLDRIEISEGWGIDVGIVLDAYALGKEIVEVDIGQLEHKHRTLEQLATTSADVTRTILQKAGLVAEKNSLIAFDFDRTLVRGSSIGFLAQKLGFSHELARLRKRHAQGGITERQLCERIAAVLKGVNSNTFSTYARQIEPSHLAHETLGYLRRKGYKVAAVSFAFKRVIFGVFGQDAFDEVVCPEMGQKNGLLDGKVKIPNHHSERFVFNKASALQGLMKKYNAPRNRTVAVGDSASDEEMFAVAGKSACFVGDRIRADYQITALAEVVLIAQQPIREF